MPSSQQFGLSQVPVNPSFRNAAVNAVAVVPLLSHDKKGELADSHSAKSFTDLMDALRRHGKTSPSEAASAATTTATMTSDSDSDLLLVVPNSSLTRPGDWRYNDTPLKAFHWQHGCQRLRVHDGRPQNSRHAHDRLMTNRCDWIDLCPSRRTAAVIGVLNMHDCATMEDLQLAAEELHQWAVRYSTPPFEVTAHGKSFERDFPVERLFVYDSFDEESQKIDLSMASNSMKCSILAFPPADEAHQTMMDLHLNVVVSDITVAIFRDLEQKIRESNDYLESGKEPVTSQKGLARKTLNRFVSSTSGDDANEEAPARTSKNLGISQLADLVSPDSKLAKDAPPSPAKRRTVPDATAAPQESETLSKLPQLMTPLDVNGSSSPGGGAGTSVPPRLSLKDGEAVRKRDSGRREKFAADLCLLAGSPLDGYERYLKAAEMCKTGTVDPLWHASALEGCAAAHIAMAEAGGYSVDEYLENNFQLPEDIMALAKEDPTAKRQSASANKQTLPEVVFALCDEALNILSRNERIGHLYTELLLKLAGYCAEEAEVHLRCGWGVGDGCYEGEQGDEPRWKRTSVSKLDFNPLVTKDGDSMLAINTHIRMKRLCELLSRAVSVGSLDPATRVDVAACSARICLDGIKPAHWKGPLPERLKLPRKAAFFTSVAAESITVSRSEGTEQTASDLWLLATQLYTRRRNPTDGGGDYGWATLRAFCFDCLSMQGNGKLSLEAAEQLLSLLGELDPVTEEDISMRSTSKVDKAKASEGKTPEEADDGKRVEKTENKDVSMPTGGMQPKRASSIADADLEEAITAATQFAKNVRTSYTNFTATSTYLAHQSRWANDDPIPPVTVPLSDSSPMSSSLVSLKSVWPKMDYEMCSSAQKSCLDRTATLRRAIPTSSNSKIDAGSVYGFTGKALPLYVSSAMAIHSDLALELECVQKRSVADESKQGAMATFYNPYGKKDAGKSSTVTVAEEEERAMLVKFGNRLALPLEVQRGQLEFDNNSGGRVKAAALSFVVPPKATEYTVHFPFTVLSKTGPEDDNTDATFEVKGLSLTCFGRSFFLPIKTLSRTGSHSISGNIPESASNYPYRVLSKDADESYSNPQIETHPCQPKLQICFAETGGPAEVVTIALSDGEVFSVPSLRLVNYLGHSKGKIDCLQIISANATGGKLFDSDDPPGIDESEANFVQDLIYEENPQPFKLRALGSTLKLASINSSKDLNSEGNNITLQFAAAHNLGKQLPNPKGATVKVQFRYRGKSSDTEVWRKREVTFHLMHAKGPRMSSIAFRPDLVQISSFADLSGQKKPPSEEELNARKPIMNDSDFAIKRIGLDADASVCSNECVFVLTVANETRSVLTVSRDGEPVGGFETHPLDKMIVRTGVSAKIPVVMPRFDRVDKDGKPVDVIAQLIAKTSLVWEQHKGGESGPIRTRGRIRIPFACISDIVNKLPSILTQICKPPCTIELNVMQKPSCVSGLTVSLGSPVDVSVNMEVASWVPKDVIDVSSLTMEFRCVRKDRRVGEGRDFVWAGKLRQKVELSDQDRKLSHRANIIFCKPGTYAVSTCARIARNAPDKSGDVAEEVWWAPVAQVVLVEETKLPAQ